MRRFAGLVVLFASVCCAVAGEKLVERGELALRYEWERPPMFRGAFVFQLPIAELETVTWMSLSDGRVRAAVRTQSFLAGPATPHGMFKLLASPFSGVAADPRQQSAAQPGYRPDFSFSPASRDVLALFWPGASADPSSLDPHMTLAVTRRASWMTLAGGVGIRLGFEPWADWGVLLSRSQRTTAADEPAEWFPGPPVPGSMHHLLTTATVDNLRLVASSGLSYAHFAPIGILFRLGIFPELPRFHHDSPAEPLRISLASVIATPHYRDSSGTRPSKAALLHGGAGIDLKTLRIRVRGILTAGWTSNAYHYVVPLISLLRPLTYETEIDARLELGAPVLESVGCKAGASRPLTDDAETWDYTVETRLAFPPIADLARITVRGKGAFGAQEAVEIVATVAVKLTTRGVAWMPAGSRLTAAVTGAARFSDGLDVEAGGRVLVSYQIRGPE